MNNPAIHKMLVSSLLSASVFATAIIATAQAAEPSKPAKFVAPKTEFGHPDLRGVWNFSSNTPLERPAQYKDREFLTREEVIRQHEQVQARSEASDNASGGGVGGYNQFWVESAAQDANFRTSLIIDPPDGRMPPLKSGVKSENGGLGPDTGGQRPVRFRVGGVRKDGPEDRGLSERCLMGFNSGPPFMPSMYNNNVQIFQSKTHVVLMTEMIHDARVVALDNRPPLDSAITQWSGDSRGRWEGNTLVVETRNFTDKINVFRGAGTGATMQLTERFTRVGRDRVDYQFTINDPNTFTKPFTALVPMIRADGELFEYACHEGNYGLSNVLSGAREEEREAAGKKK
ncbi:MAG: hypothetical protein H7Y02_06105 [Candidatus Obscuribacterales bacterium]|nr:hypothetical protein [Steroidobacteraceae bacterium]